MNPIIQLQKLQPVMQCGMPRPDRVWLSDDVHMHVPHLALPGVSQGPLSGIRTMAVLDEGISLAYTCLSGGRRQQNWGLLLPIPG